MMEQTMLYDLARRFVAPVLAPFYGGMASILVFHRVVEPAPIKRPGWLGELEVAPALIETLIKRLRGAGHEIVSLDELREALVERRTPRAKLVALTFDDGYVDAYTTIYPLLTSYNVPFTLYLTTDFPDRRIAPWWYLLEARLAQGGPLRMRLHGRDLSYPLETPRQIDAAFAEVGAILDAGTPADRWALAAEVFGPGEVARAMDAEFMRWDQVKDMAAHPLVTIGAHTISHAPLKLLSLEEARFEMVESRRRIEAQIDRPVRHFAYPYGFRALVGAREYALAKECGFDTAVTTRRANIFPDSASHLECLPRIHGRSQPQIEVNMAGLIAAFRYAGRRVVTV